MTVGGEGLGAGEETGEGRVTADKLVNGGVDAFGGGVVF